MCTLINNNIRKYLYSVKKKPPTCGYKRNNKNASTDIKIDSYPEFEVNFQIWSEQILLAK